MNSISYRIVFFLCVFTVIYSTIFVLGWHRETQFRAPPVQPSEDGVLAEFPPPCENTTACRDGSSGFFFGVATAPPHVEDELFDSWLEFATTGGPNGTGRVPAWHNTPHPEQRLRFWSATDAELDTVALSGAQLLRLGVDWGRLVPTEPSEDGQQQVDWAAVAHYKEMLRKVRARGLRVMCTLFHHSFPKWGLPGGWTDWRAVERFRMFAELAAQEFGPFVDYWVTFNEPHIWVTLTHCLGVWPPGPPASPLRSASCMLPLPGAVFLSAMRHIARAHIAAVPAIRKHSDAPIGVAHNTAFMAAFSALDLPVRWAVDWLTLFPWVDLIVDHLDFIGINYYSQEFMSLAGLQYVPEEEYSEAGRAVYPDGLFRLLLAFHRRFSPGRPRLSFLVTENGFAEDGDTLRPAYMVEHLLAVHAARKQGVPVRGYVWWTISDNWEWADGYCPKFGLAAVDRASANFTRHVRPSMHLFKQIVSTRRITEEQRRHAWDTLQAARRANETKLMCRQIDASNRMGSDSLDEPKPVHFAPKDWRFGHYQRASISLMGIRSMHIVNTWAADAVTLSTTAVQLLSSYVFGKPRIEMPAPAKAVDEL